ncbi:MAG: hypothetical protein AB7P20_03060 [Rhizobiaceae bacterium]
MTKTVRFLRLRYFAWVPVALAGYAVCHGLGVPHPIWRYAYVGGENGAPRYYASCTFVGPLGEFTRPAVTGRCGWVLFVTRPAGGAQ